MKMPSILVTAALLTGVAVLAQGTAPSENMEAASATALLDACEQAEHGQPRRAIELAWQARELIDARAQPALLSRAEGCSGWALAALGQHSEARAAANRILELTNRLELPDERIGNLRRASAILQRAEQPNESIELLQQALDLARTHQRQQQLAGLYAALGVAHSEARNHDQAIRHYETAMELAQQQDNAALQLPIQYNLGLTLRGAGQPERAREVFMNLIEPLQAPGLEIRLASLYSVLGSIARELGEMSQARQWLERSEALHADLDNPAEYAALLVDRARLEMAEDNLNLAKTYADRALEEARRADYYFSLRGALAVNVDLLSRLGRDSEALELQREDTRRMEEHLSEQQQSRLAGIEAQLGLERQARELAETRRRALELERQQARQQAVIAVTGGLLMIALAAFWWQRIGNRRLTHISRTDLLTGLPNRRAITAHLDDRSGALGSASKVLILIDLDHFKAVNDTCGHDTGDRALKQVADTLRRFAESAGGQVGRWGGEEFMLLFPQDAPEQAAQLASGLVAAVRNIQCICPRAGSVSLTASAGFAPLDGVVRDSGQERWEPAFLIADRLLYRVKARGRNGWLGAWPCPGNLLEPHRIDEQIDNRECRLLGDEPAAG